MNTDLKIILFSMWFILSFGYVILQGIKLILFKRNAKVQKIKSGYGSKIKLYNKKWISKIVNLLNPITGRFEDKEKIKLKLIRAGKPFSNLGITENNFTSFKWCFVIVIVLMMKNGNDSWNTAIMYGAMSYFMIEAVIRGRTRKRKSEIENEIDTLTAVTIDCLEQGLNEGEIFSVLANKINKENPLYEEILNAEVKIGLNTMKTNIGSILEEFQLRIDMEEIDNYCLALKHHELAGKAVRMLRKQLELLRSKEILRQKRETQHKANLNSLSTIIFVVACTILIMVPLILLAAQNDIFK